MILTVVEPIMMKNAADCGIACMAMLVGKSYGEVMAALPARRRTAVVDHEGLSVRQMKLLATRLGVRLCYSPIREQTEFYTDKAGILDLDRPCDPTKPNGEHEGHFVFYAKDTIYNPAEGLWWLDTEAFFKTRRWEAVGVLVLEDE